ncbi:hypothetical protein [Clostridium sp.]|uniref:DUF6979 family protein n=1 Tax=Clostridium sp. TaxID=1506 RepID=UPI001A4DBA32|nr:hypothetical protein [Clostridium sp.]MBK5237280.1 hypothetical protein [Clostridium sp.]
MSKFGECALKSLKLILEDNSLTPREAWQIVSIELFGEGTSSQRKVCPKSTFLGLCEEGLVKGIEKGKYTASKKNKYYGLTAVGILEKNMHKIFEAEELWSLVTDNKEHDGQMDIVLELWENGMIFKK